MTGRATAMDMVVERRLEKLCLRYQFKALPEFLAEVEPAAGVGMYRVNVSCNGEPRYTLKQKNVAQKIIALLLFPFISQRTWPVYQCYEQGKYIGHTIPQSHSPKERILLHGSHYELYLHGNNYISILKDGIQIALAQRSYKLHCEQAKFFMTVDEALEPDLCRILLLIAYADEIYFPQRLRWEYLRMEKTVAVPKDKYRERLLWQPQQTGKDKGTVLLPWQNSGNAQRKDETEEK